MKKVCNTFCWWKTGKKIRFLSLVLIGIVGLGFGNLFWIVSANQTSTLQPVSVSRETFSKNLQEAANQSFENSKAQTNVTLKEINDKNKAEQAAAVKKAEEAESATLGININADCMAGVGCEFSLYDAVGIRKDRPAGERTSVMAFLQDIILGASMFIGTVAAVAFILSGVYYIFSTADASYKKEAQNGMKYAIYGMVIVMLAIVIVRVVQFIARGGS